MGKVLKIMIADISCELQSEYCVSNKRRILVEIRLNGLSTIQKIIVDNIKHFSNKVPDKFHHLVPFIVHCLGVFCDLSSICSFQIFIFLGDTKLVKMLSATSKLQRSI